MSTDALPAAWQSIAAELATFYRELPRLLDEGEEGRHAVIRGDRVYAVWDTFRDATQYGYDTFSDPHFLAQTVDSRLLPVLAQYFGPAAMRETA